MLRVFAQEDIYEAFNPCYFYQCFKCWQSLFLKDAVKENFSLGFLLLSVMSTIVSWYYGDILLFKDAKPESHSGLQQSYILCEYSAEGSSEEVWMQTAVLEWFENSHSGFWKALCDLSIISLNPQTQKYTITALQYFEIIVKLFSVASHLKPSYRSYWQELGNKLAKRLTKKKKRGIETLSL